MSISTSLGSRFEVSISSIIVHGRSGTYYARQLALAVVMDAIETSNLEPKDVEVDIQIYGSA